ncbi:MAG: DUF1254 domain-containing protein [Archaeoglobaceae archaeon]
MKSIAIFAIFAVFTHIAFVIAFPYAIVIGNYLATKKDVKPNTVYHEKVIDASFKKVVMPSPDILYSACVFDLSDKDLLITARVPEFTYWSVSFYALNTDNFFVVNDQSVRGEFRAVLSLNKSCKDCIISPSSKGIIIFRIFIPDNSLLPEIIEYQKSIKCEQIAK